MKIEYAQVNDVNGRLTVTLDESDYADKVKKQLKEIGKKRPEPGFRPGHVPAALLERKYGAAVKYDVINDVVSDAIFNYIKENNLHVIGNPVADKENTVAVDQKDFTLKFSVGLAPTLDIKVDKDLHVPFYKIEVTDEMVNRQDDSLRKRFGKQEPGDTVDESALVKGVITELDENGSVKEGGVVVEGGIVAPQYFKDDAQRNLFLGKHVGDTVVFNPAKTCEANATELSSMLGIDKDDTSNHLGDFSFEIKEIIVLKPAELGEEFYKAAFGKELKDEEEYRNTVKEMIEASLAGDENFRFTVDAEKAIRKEIGNVELPDEILKDFLMRQNEALNAENIDEEYNQIRDQLVWDLVKDQLMTNLNVQVTDDDLKKAATMMARNQFAQYGMASMSEYAVDHYAHEILKDDKARDALLRHTNDTKLFQAMKGVVTLDVKNVSVEQFNDLFRNDDEAEK